MVSLPRSLSAADHLEIGRQQRRHRRGQIGRQKPLDALVPFAAAVRFPPGKIVEPGAGMGVDHPERRGLGAQIMQDAAKHRMFEHIGEITGMKSVAIVQRALSRVPPNAGQYRLNR